MDIHFEEPHPLVLVIRPRFPRLDALTAADFRAATRARVARRVLVVLDLSEVAGIDSTGLSVIVGLLKAIPPGGQLRLAGASRSVRALLELTRLNRIFRVFDCVADAIVAYKVAS